MLNKNVSFNQISKDQHKNNSNIASGLSQNKTNHKTDNQVQKNRMHYLKELTKMRVKNKVGH